MRVCLEQWGGAVVALEWSPDEDMLFHINPRKIKALNCNSTAALIKELRQQSRKILN